MKESTASLAAISTCDALAIAALAQDLPDKNKNGCVLVSLCDDSVVCVGQ